MALPTVQFRRHRIGYSVAAIIGFLAAWQGYYWLKSGSVALFFGWCFLIVGLIAGVGCSWTAIRHAVVLELNQEGIIYQKDRYAWNTLRSYAIKKVIGEGSLAVYLILSFTDNRAPLEIQLAWMENSDSIPDQMKVYASYFQIQFNGIEKKEV
jgi:hypothetical protein